MICFSDNILNCELQNVKIGRCNETVFCGHMSTFSFYPNCNNYIVMEFVQMIPNGKHAISKFSFCMIDNDVIENIPTLLNLKLTLMCKINRIYFLKVYFIQVEKNRHIVFKTANMICYQFVIRDGPELSSTTLRLLGNTATTSTFQCIVLVVTLNANIHYEDIVIRYVSKYNVVFKQYTLHHETDMTIQMPFGTCPKNYCALHFYAINKLQVNITVLNINIKRNKSLSCTHAGLVVSDYYKEETLCNQQRRMIYSFNSSLTLALYWYSKLASEIKGLMKISTTKCSLVQIDACFIEIACARSTVECSSYLESATQFSKIVFSYRNSTIKITRMTDICTILQVSTTHNLTNNEYDKLVSEKYPDWCKLFLAQVKSVSSIYQLFFTTQKNWQNDDFAYQEIRLRHCELEKNTTLFCQTNIDRMVPKLVYHLQDNELNSSIIQTRNVSDQEVVEITVCFSYKTENWIHMLIGIDHKLDILKMKIFVTKDVPSIQKTINLETVLSPLSTLSATVLIIVNIIEKYVKEKPLSLALTIVQKSSFHAFKNLLGWTKSFWIPDENLIFASKYLLRCKVIRITITLDRVNV